VFTAIECASDALRLRMPSSNNVETMFVQKLSRIAFLFDTPTTTFLFSSYANPSNYQLGVMSMQQNISFAYYSKKLNDTQKKCTTLKKEMLNIYKTFTNFTLYF
jgi:hypothetical protein